MLVIIKIAYKNSISYIYIENIENMILIVSILLY